MIYSKIREFTSSYIQSKEHDNSDYFEVFEKSFEGENPQNNRPSNSVIKNDDGVVDVRTTVSGKQLCYKIDATKDLSSPACYKCNDEVKFKGKSYQ